MKESTKELNSKEMNNAVGGGSGRIIRTTRCRCPECKKTAIIDYDAFLANYGYVCPFCNTSIRSYYVVPELPIEETQV